MSPSLGDYGIPIHASIVARIPGLVMSPLSLPPKEHQKIEWSVHEYGDAVAVIAASFKSSYRHKFSKPEAILCWGRPDPRSRPCVCARSSVEARVLNPMAETGIKTLTRSSALRESG